MLIYYLSKSFFSIKTHYFHLTELIIIFTVNPTMIYNNLIELMRGGISLIESLEILADPLIRNRIKTLYSNPDLKQFSSECDQYLKTIRESLPDNLQHTLFLYEDALTSLQAVLENKIYLQGFKDALYLINELHIQMK